MTDRCSLGDGHIARLVSGQALALACVLLACVPVSAGAAAVPEEFYGINSGHTLVNDAATRPAALRAMRAGGLSFVRVDASWGAIEPVAPVAGVHTYVSRFSRQAVKSWRLPADERVDEDNDHRHGHQSGRR
ncbi:MAG: hypothetical protein WKF48_11035 [Solirubrobacteraceae bacterium]